MFVRRERSVENVVCGAMLLLVANLVVTDITTDQALKFFGSHQR